MSFAHKHYNGKKVLFIDYPLSLTLLTFAVRTVQCIRAEKLRKNKTHVNDHKNLSPLPRNYLSQTPYHRFASFLMYVTWERAPSHLFRAFRAAEIVSCTAKNSEAKNLLTWYKKTIFSFWDVTFALCQPTTMLCYVLPVRSTISFPSLHSQTCFTNKSSWNLSHQSYLHTNARQSVNLSYLPFLPQPARKR